MVKHTLVEILVVTSYLLGEATSVISEKYKISEEEVYEILKRHEVLRDSKTCLCNKSNFTKLW